MNHGRSRKRRGKNWRKIVGTILSITMVCSLLIGNGTFAASAETGSDPENTGVCNHVHDESCYEEVFRWLCGYDDNEYVTFDNKATTSNATGETYSVATPSNATPSDATASDAEGETHVHNEDCDCEIELVLNCQHVHDENCGYYGNTEPAVSIEDLQARIDALPSVEEYAELDADAKNEVYAEAQELCDLFDALTEEEQAQVDVEKLYALLLAFTEQTAAVDTSAEHTDHTGWTAISGNNYSTQTWDGSANYYLSGDAVCRIINVTGNVILCLNGKTLRFQSNNNYHIVVKDGATLTLCDCSSGEAGKITRLYTGDKVAGGAVLVESGGTLIMESGTIRDIFTAGMSSGAYSGGGVYVNGGTFTMNGGTISNCTVTGSSVGCGGGAVYVKSGTFTMNGGEITGCGNYDDDETYYGGAVYVNGGTFALTDGTISGCSSKRDGGAVYVKSGTFTMSGGTLTGNTAGYGGGAVYSADTVTISGGTICGNTTTGIYGGAGIYADNGTLTISGGLITGNTASVGGGGVYVGSATAEMTGGAVNGNTGTTFGGGICLKSGTMTITGGEIKDNVGNSCLGGAIYVDSGTLYLQNVVITNNTASDGGDTSTGGIWNCSSGTTKMYLTDGGAVYGNSGYQVYSDEGGTHNWFISAYMLGGGAYNWMDKNGDSVNVYELGTGNIFLKNNPSEDSIKAANEKAEVIISGNSTDQLGGAIAVNGNLIIGTYDLYDIPVRKVWEDSETAGFNRPDSITVYLKYMEQDTGTGEWNVYDGYIASAELNEENNWSYTFEGYELPQGMAFTVEEETLPGYEGYVYGVATENGYAFYITNYDTTQISVVKSWEDNNNSGNTRPDSITVNLLANGEETGQTLTLNEENGWAGTFTGLAFYDEDGEQITYSVEETKVEGYTGYVYGLTTGSQTEYHLENVLDGSLTVKKTLSGEGADSDKAFTFTVTLDNSANSEEKINGTYGDMTFENGVANFTLKGGESKTATGLPAGVTYEVVESDNEGYEVTITVDGTEVTTAIEGETIDKASGTIDAGGESKVVFNNHKDDDTPGGGGDNPEPTTTELTVKKVWTLDDGGIAADSVSVNLLKDGEVSETVTLSAENDWTYTWTDLDDSYTWTVEEADVPDGFTSSVTNEGAVWTITNNDTPGGDTETGSLTVKKTVSGGGASTSKAFTFTVTLSDTSINGTYGDMEFTDGVATFTLKHGESRTANGLPLGVTYTVSEDSDSYTPSVTEGSLEGTITADGTTVVVNNYKKGSSGGGGGGGSSTPEPTPDNPDSPDTPSNPDEPSNPDTPSNPDNPATPDSPNTPDTSTPDTPLDDVPQTGDNTHLSLWLTLMLLSILGMAGTVAIGRKTRYRGAYEAGHGRSRRKR